MVDFRERGQEFTIPRLMSPASICPRNSAIAKWCQFILKAAPGLRVTNTFAKNVGKSFRKAAYSASLLASGGIFFTFHLLLHDSFDIGSQKCLILVYRW